MERNEVPAEALAQRYTFTVNYEQSMFRARCHEFSGVEYFAASGPMDALQLAIDAVEARLGETPASEAPPASNHVAQLAELGPALRIAYAPSTGSVRQALWGLLGRECRTYLANGGTVDELGVELQLSLSDVAALMARPMPE